MPLLVREGRLDGRARRSGAPPRRRRRGRVQRADEGRAGARAQPHRSRRAARAPTRRSARSAVPRSALVDDAPIPIDFDLGDTDKLVETLEKGRPRRDVGASDDDKPIEQSDNSLVRLINNMIVEAHNDGVSDIHIESYPGREKIRVRFRKDGVLRTYLELPHELPQRADRAHQDHVRPRHQRAPQAAGRQDQLRASSRRSTSSSCASRRSRPTTASRTW